MFAFNFFSSLLCFNFVYRRAVFFSSRPFIMLSLFQVSRCCDAFFLPPISHHNHVHPLLVPHTHPLPTPSSWMITTIFMFSQVVCEATQCTDANVRKAAYEAIWTIATLYYDRLQAYMQPLFELTLRTIREDQEDVALNAMEFWSSLCDEEVGLFSLL